MAALTAAARGVDVTLVDAAPVTGRKFRLAGGGMGNVTNRHIRPEAYTSQHPAFCTKALRRFTPDHMLALLAAHGLDWEEREAGELFCRVPVAHLVDSLTERCTELGARFLLNRELHAVCALDQPALPGEADADESGKKGEPNEKDEPEAIRSTPPAWTARHEDARSGTACSAKADANAAGSGNARSGDACSGDACSRNTRSGATGVAFVVQPEHSPSLRARPCGEEMQGASADRAALSAPAARFVVSTSEETIYAQTLLLALGSPAWPSCGASDQGLRLARSLGHRIEPPHPVLVPFILPPDWPLHGLAGLSLPACIRLGQRAFTRDLLFTHKGLSGPAALLASTFWRPGEALDIDFLPEQRLLDALDAAPGKSTTRTFLRRLLPQRLADTLLDQAPPQNGVRPLPDRHLAQLDRAARQHLAALVHKHRCFPARTAGMVRAEAAAGGVDVSAVNPASMESRLLPGLFFAGEILDVTGMLGGYNLHWAFASAQAAALGACRRLEQS